MSDPRQGWLRAIALGLAVFVVYGAAGYACRAMLGASGAWLAVWPSSAIAMILMLRLGTGWRGDLSISVATLAAAIAVHAWSGAGPAAALAHGLIELATLLLQVQLGRRYAPRIFRNAADGWRFGLIVGAPAFALGTLATAGVAILAGDQHVLARGGVWFVSHALGFLFVAPFGMTLSGPELGRLHLETRSALAVAVLTLVSVAAELIFTQGQPALLLLLVPPLMLATFQFRLAGATVAAGAVAVIGLIMTGQGHGPLISSPAGFERLLLLQLSVTCLCLSMLPVAMVLDQRDRLAGAVERQRLTQIDASETRSRFLDRVDATSRVAVAALLDIQGLLRERVRGGIDRRLEGVLRRHQRSLQALADELIDLDAPRIRWPRHEPGGPVVGDALDHVRAGLAGASRRAGSPLLVRPTAALSDRVAADPVRFREVLLLLARNALVCGSGHGPVMITASRLDDRFLRIEMVAGGPGLSPEHQAELFLPPAQEMDAEVVAGLFPAKALVERDGGRIAFESAPRQGARFWVDLPLAA